MQVNYGYWCAESCGVCIEYVMQDDVAHIIDADNGYIGTCYSFSGFENLINTFYGKDSSLDILLNDVDINEEKLMDVAREWFGSSKYESNNKFKLFE